jgi:hypothetical protein
MSKCNKCNWQTNWVNDRKQICKFCHFMHAGNEINATKGDYKCLKYRTWLTSRFAQLSRVEIIRIATARSICELFASQTIWIIVPKTNKLISIRIRISDIGYIPSSNIIGTWSWVGQLMTTIVGCRRPLM